MTTQRYPLNGPANRRAAVRAIAQAADAMVCEIRPATRSLDQNSRLHAMFADVARQVEFFGQKRDAETVKRLLIDAFARVKAAMNEPLYGYGQVLPSLDGSGVVQLGLQTRTFSKALMSEFVDYLHAWGVDNDVRWTGPVEVPGWYQDKPLNEQGIAV